MVFRQNCTRDALFVYKILYFLDCIQYKNSTLKSWRCIHNVLCDNLIEKLYFRNNLLKIYIIILIPKNNIIYTSIAFRASSISLESEEIGVTSAGFAIDGCGNDDFGEFDEVFLLGVIFLTFPTWENMPCLDLHWKYLIKCK